MILMILGSVLLYGGLIALGFWAMRPRASKAELRHPFQL